jgi:putative ATP-dependent endonuclease of OLD family
MKLTRVKIENFRGVRHLDLELGKETVLIGENNAGKSSVLQALRVCLRDLSPRRRSLFEPYDVHLPDDQATPSTAPQIRITVWFSVDGADSMRVRRLNTAGVLQIDPLTSAYSVALRVESLPPSGGVEALQHDWCFLDSSGQPLPKDERGLSIFQQELSYTLLDALRDATRSFDARGAFWRPFLQEQGFDPKVQADIEAQLRAVNKLVIGSHKPFDSATARLNRVQKVVPIPSGDQVAIEAVPSRVFDLLTRAQVHLGTPTGAKVPIDHHGEGTQSLSVLMLFAAFLDLEAAAQGAHKAPIVGLEEPEAHLHPSAVRALWKVIQDIPGQKLISTHSGELLAEVPLTSLCRLVRRRDGSVSAHRITGDTFQNEDLRKFEYHVRQTRGELLFARCWVLVEGETEVTLLTEIARHLSMDLARYGVRVVPYRNGANISLFLSAARDLGIAWCVLPDNDEQQAKHDLKKIRAALPAAAAIDDHLHLMDEKDIEAHLCANGFRDIFEPTQTFGRAKKLAKPEAALLVIDKIRDDGAPPPPLLVNVLTSALKLAEGA